MEDSQEEIGKLKINKLCNQQLMEYKQNHVNLDKNCINKIIKDIESNNENLVITIKN